MARGTIGLAMIVKDEAHTIARTLATVKPILSSWVVLDTGSNDDTRDVVERVLDDMPGSVVSTGFVDYSTCRNRALDRVATPTRCFACGAICEFETLHDCKATGRAVKDAAREFPPDFTLSLSADEILHNPGALRDFLATYDGPEDAFLVEVRTESESFLYPRVLRTGSPWRYEGVVHEEPRHQQDRDKRATVQIPGCWIEHRATDPERRAKRLRDFDLPALERAIETATGSTELVRLLALLAQTHEGIAQGEAGVLKQARHQFAALGCYAVIAHDEAAPEKARTHAAFKYLNVAEQVGVYTSPEMVLRLTGLRDASPANPAIAYMLAAHAMRVDAKVGLEAAYRAARVARDAVKDPTHPHDPHGLLWRSHWIAAWCAQQLGHGPAMQKSVAAGIEAGGPAEQFAQFSTTKGRAS